MRTMSNNQQIILNADFPNGLDESNLCIPIPDSYTSLRVTSNLSSTDIPFFRVVFQKKGEGSRSRSIEKENELVSIYIDKNKKLPDFFYFSIESIAVIPKNKITINYEFE